MSEPIDDPRALAGSLERAAVSVPVCALRAASPAWAIEGKSPSADRHLANQHRVADVDLIAEGQWTVYV